MSHFDFARPNGVYAQETVPGAQDYQRLDVKQGKSINGDLGGTWNPSAPIVLGGSGTHLGANSAIQGGVITVTGGRLMISSAAGSLPQLLQPRTRTITGPVVVLQSGTPSYFDVPSRYMHDGARLATVAVSYILTTRPTATPSIYPTIQIVPKLNTGVNGTLNPASLAVWQAAHVYALNSYVTPTLANDAGMYFKATAIAGTHTSGANEAALSPANWDNTVGHATIDNAGANQITWTCIGRSGQYAAKGSTFDTIYNAGIAQTLFLDLDGAGVNLLTFGTQSYQIIFTAAGTNLNYALTTMAITLDTIISLQLP